MIQPNTLEPKTLEPTEDAKVQRTGPPLARLPASSEKRVVILCLLLAAVTLVFYNPIARNQFIDFDDLLYILKNSHIQGSLTWSAVKWSFTTFYSGNWHPLTWWSHALDYQIFHLNPIGHHYTNLLLHTANAILLFLLLRRATGLTWPSLVVAALFALHPINVESVAWAAERKNVLSMLFFLLALHAYDRYGRTGKRHLYWLVAVLFALGLMAKPQIVTLPFVLLLWDYWPVRRIEGFSTPGDSPNSSHRHSLGYLVWEKMPFFFLAAADSIVTVMAQRAGDTVRTLSEVSASWRMENVLVSYVRYLGKAFWPSHLVPMYTRPDSLPAWQIVGAAALLLTVSALVIWRRRPYLTFGWLWFLGTLVPMIGIITVGEQAMADRYAYLPFIGLFVAAVWTINDWTINDWAINAGTIKDGTVDELATQRRMPNGVLAGAAVLVLFCLGCLTYRQIGYWRDSETLWRYALRIDDRNFTAHNNLALALVEQGRTDEAVAEFRKGRALHRYPPAQVLSLAWYELRFGHPQEAIEECTSVLRDSSDPASPDPGSPDPRVQAVAWSELGQAHLQLHQYDQAVESLDHALRLNPEDGMALMGSGVIALHQGKPDLAVTQLLHAVKVDPSDVNVLLLEQALRRARRPEDAENAAAQLRKNSPDLREAQTEAGKILAFAEVQPLSELKPVSTANK